MTKYNCGYACGFTEPYGFVPETGCPIHDTVEFSAIINAVIAREQERCAQIAFDIGYLLADEAESKLHDGWTASDLIVDASEKIAAAIRAPATGSQGGGKKMEKETRMKTVLTLTGTRDALEKFKGYLEGPPRIEAVKIEDSRDGLTVTVRERDAEFVTYVAEKFGCTAEIIPLEINKYSDLDDFDEYEAKEVGWPPSLISAAVHEIHRREMEPNE